MNNLNLSNLPTEIHHEIFVYMDYVRDVCCHPFLNVPTISMPSTLKEFDELLSCEELLEFDNPNSGHLPFFLACKSLLKSVRSFSPTILNLKFFNGMKLSKYQLDYNYLDLLNMAPCVKHQYRNKPLPTSNEWLDVVMDFVKKMKKICNKNPFRQVEFLSLSSSVGKNCFAAPSRSQNVNLLPFLDFLPSVKYFLMDFYLHSEMKNQLLAPKVLVHASISDYYQSTLRNIDNIYWSCVVWEEAGIPIIALKDVFPSKYRTNIEIFLYNSIVSHNFEEANIIIDNFKLDIEFFSHIWNIQSNTYVQSKFEVDNLEEIMDTLYKVYEKYPSFKVFRIPIYSFKCLKIIMSYPFVNIHVDKNITVQFLESISQQEDDATSLCRDYHVDFSKIGSFRFSAACITKASNLKADRDACDIFGISPSMLTMLNLNIHTRDKFGNNILHYFFNNISNYHFRLSLLDQIPENDLKQLLKEPNNYNVTPIEIGVFTRFKMRYENFSKKFNYEGFAKTCGNHLPKLLLLDGLNIDVRILLATLNVIEPHYNYDDYRDINFRDENGKHLVHYTISCFDDTILKYLNLHLIDTIFCKDISQTIPIQTCTESYYTVLDRLGKIKNLPKLNFVSYTNDFGMLRILYLLVNDNNTYTEKMKTESNSLGFDYSSGQPLLVSLSSHYLDGLYYFSVEQSVLKQLRNIKYFGTVDGDDISHFLVRFYLNKITENPQNNIDSSILKVLIDKGLKLDIVRNSKGQTAFDIFEQFRGSLREMSEIRRLMKDCKKGRSTKSKALPKFTIKYTNIPKELIVEESETTLVIKSNIVSPYRIRIGRSFYFQPKPYKE